MSPPDKIAAFESSRFQTTPEQAEQFRDEVIIPTQRLFEHALDRILVELGVTDWEIELPVTDLTDEQRTANVMATLANTRALTVNEVRQAGGYDPLSGDHADYGRQIAGRPEQQPGPPLPAGVVPPPPVAKGIEQDVIERLKKLEHRIARALGQPNSR